MENEYTKLAAEKLREADAILICAGAGMGVDSGLPDFRGPQGFWKAYPPIAKLGLAFEEMANPRWFRERPSLAWAFYGHRRNVYRETIPHEGFKLLLELGKSKPNGYFVFTSNVDGQFQKAGFDPERIVECHGSIELMQCTQPCSRTIWPAENTEIVIDADRFEALDPLPRCTCGRLARPNILMFGDGNWIETEVDEQYKRLSEWLTELGSAKLAVIEMGAGKAVPTVRFFAERSAKKQKGVLIRINPRDFEGPQWSIPLQAGAVDGLKAILQNY